MNTVTLRLTIAVLLFVAAWLCRSEATLATRVAGARQQMATLQFEVDDTLTPSASISDYLQGDEGSLSENIRRIHTTVAYWTGGYDDVMNEAGRELDPAILLTAANAAFRASERTGGVGAEQVQRLDGVLQAYASVLKAAPRHADAAYNYEYVSRLRDRVAARPSGKTPSVPQPVAASRAGDLPDGSTIHGRPGGPPPEAKAEQFQVIAPMEYGDREAQPEATPGGKIQRKG